MKMAKFVNSNCKIGVRRLVLSMNTLFCNFIERLFFVYGANDNL